MPVTLKKLPRKPLYRVSTPGRITAKATTKKKAEAQARLLRAIDHGWKPTKRAHESADKLVNGLLESPYCYSGSPDDRAALLWYYSEGRLVLNLLGRLMTYRYEIEDKGEAAAVLRRLGITPATEPGIKSGTLPIEAVEQLKGLPIYTKIKSDLDAHCVVDLSKDKGIRKFVVDNVEFNDFIREFSDYVMVRSDYSTVHVPAYRRLGFVVFTVSGNKFIHELLMLVPEAESARAARRLTKLTVGAALSKQESATKLVDRLVESPYYYSAADNYPEHEVGEWSLYDFSSPRLTVRIYQWKIGGTYHVKNPDAVLAFKRLAGIDAYSGYSTGTVQAERNGSGVWFDDLLKLPELGPQLTRDQALNTRIEKKATDDTAIRTRLSIADIGRHFKDITLVDDDSFVNGKSRALFASLGLSIVELTSPGGDDYFFALVPDGSVEKFARQVAQLELEQPPPPDED